jgi:hypothetical protein
LEPALNRLALAALPVVLALALALAAASPARAGDLSRTFQADRLSVTVIGPEPVSVETDASFRVRVSPADGVRLRAVAVPRTGTDSTPARTSVNATRPGSFAVLVSFPVRGNWTLVLFLSTAADSGQVDIPVTVAAPGAIPVWLGWAIGLAPLLGLALFLGSQVRLARRLERERADALTG